MIPFASQRGGGQDLATHLQNEYDNEIMEVVEVRGAVARDLHGAFKEWEVQAETLTRCRKYLYSLSINPDPGQGELTRDQYRDYIAKAETALGLSGQPRAIVFHTKHGREHCHVVWSRIDAERQKAIHIAFDRETLMQVTRTFAREHYLDLPAGYDKRGQGRGQDTLYERAQLNETGLSKADHMQRVTAAWQLSDNPKAFVQALSEQGYIVARGKRPYVLVDIYGGMHALSKLIDDKSVKTKDVRAYLEKDFPAESLPSVEEAEDLAAKHRKRVSDMQAEDRLGLKLEKLRHAQRLRQLAVEQERQAVLSRHHREREIHQARHGDERRELIEQQETASAETKLRRAGMRSTGLAAFLGKISGVAAIRRAVHRYQDRKLAEAQYQQRVELSHRQEEERKALLLRQKVECKMFERKTRAVQRLEAREVSSLRRDDLRDHRIEDRGPENTMSPIDRNLDEGKVVPCVTQEFDRAARPDQDRPPDIRSAFRNAAADREADVSGEDERERGQDPDGPQRTR